MNKFLLPLVFVLVLVLSLTVSPQIALAQPIPLTIPPPGGSDFASPFLGDFKCYDVVDDPVVRVSIGLDDQFDEITVDTIGPIKVCLNVVKAESFDPPYRESPEPSIRQIDPTVDDQHFTVYRVCESGTGSTGCIPPQFDPRFVGLVDQFGFTDHNVIKPIELWVPATKDLDGLIPTDFEKRHDIHYKCYEIEPKANESPFNVPFLVSLTDQFGFTQHTILEATKFCNPVIKTFQFPAGSLDVEHLKCYPFVLPIGNTISSKFFTDQFGFHEVNFIQDEELCVSADKIPILPIGGTIIPIDKTSLLLVGAQMTASWMIPVIIAGIGIAIVIARKF